MSSLSVNEELRRCWLIATIGVILFGCGVVILFWNEGRAVHAIISLDEALNAAVTIDQSDNDGVENSYEGQVIHIIGPIIVGEPLTEPDYNIQVLAVKLRRRVQMYQWVEESVEHNYGESIGTVETDTKTYYYTTEWRDKLIDSRQFYIQTGHHNPKKFPIESEIQVADSVYIGRYELGNEIKDKFNNFVEVTSDARPEDPSIKLHLGLYYHSNDLFHPEVGDVRLLFSFAGMEGELYTIVGQVQKGKIVPYKSVKGMDVLLVFPGEHSLTEVFAKEHHSQRLTTWGFRFMGWVCLFLGATFTASLTHIILQHLRYISLIPDPQYPYGKNAIISLSLALIVTSLSWAMHKPLIGVALLLAALSPFLYFANIITKLTSSE